MQVSTIITILTAIVALGSALSGPGLDIVFPGKGTVIAGAVSLLALVAGIVLNAIKAQAPASAIIADAPVLPKGTVLHPATPENPDGHPTVISTTSTLLPSNGGKAIV